MNASRLRSVLLIPLFTASAVHGEPLIKKGDHLAFIGDALTAEPGYPILVSDYVVACAQVPDVELAQFGWVAKTADAVVPNLEGAVQPFKPTVATIFFPSNGADAEARRTGETSLIEALKKEGVRTIVLGSPKCEDNYVGDPAKGAAMNQALKTIADGDKDLAAKEGIVYADVFGATTSALSAVKQKFGPKFPFDPSTGFHNRSFTIAVAYAFLKALGFDGDLGSITADYGTKATSATPGHTVASFDDQLLVAQSKIYPFSYPMQAGPAPGQLFSCVPFNQDLNRLVLTVKNLPPQATGAKITWNAPTYGGQRWKDFTTAELAKGISLPDVGESPFASRLAEISGFIADHLENQQAADMAREAGTPDANSEGRARAALANARAAVTPIPYTLHIQPIVAPDPPGPKPIPVIVDTDMSSDIDDGGALALINSFTTDGEAKLLACAVDMVDRDESSGAVCKAINTYYGNGDVPIGAYHGKRDRQLSGSLYTKAVHQQFCPDFPPDDKLPDGVDIYRKVLATAADDSVVICSIGLLTNVEDLEDSKPDAVSPLSGIDLIKKKVKKIVIMANTLPTDQHILDAFPKPIVWTTYIGSYIGIGKALIPTPKDNPVRFAYEHNGNAVHNCLLDGRQAWDPTAAWLAVRGPGEMWDMLGYGTYRIDAAGNVDWRSSDSTKETLATYKMPNKDVAAIMDAQLAQPPKAQTAVK